MNSPYKPLSPLRRVVLIGLGTATLGLGIAGMFLPGVPTTVFLLITLGCYVRSSERLYNWVMTRPWLQKPLQTALRFKEKGALPVRIKLIAQGVAWASVVLTVFTGARPVFQLITIILALSCTIAMAIIKTEGEPYAPRAWQRTGGDIARQLTYGALAGALAGLIWGFARSVIMRLVANLAMQPQQFAPHLMLPILWGAILVGALAGLAYAGVRRALPANKWVNGAIFGLLVACTLALALYLIPTMQPDIARGEQASSTLLFVLFIPNFVAFGVITCLAFRSLEMHRPSPASQPSLTSSTHTQPSQSA